MKHERFVFKNISQIIQRFSIPKKDRELIVLQGQYVSVWTDSVVHEWYNMFLKCNHMRYIGKIVVEEFDTRFFVGNGIREIVKW